MRVKGAAGSLGRSVAMVVCLLSACAGSVGAQAAEEECGARPRRAARWLVRGALAEGALETLERRSVTGRDLVVSLRSQPKLMVHVNVVPQLRSSVPLHGRTRFFFSDGILVAVVDIEPRRTVDARVTLLAHELAHTLELATHGEARTRADLEAILRRSAWLNNPSDPLRRWWDSAFAEAIEQQVSRELRSRAKVPSRLARLARAHNVPLAPCASSVAVASR